MTFAERVLAHYRRQARDLPWRRTRDPYAIWVSEIMLQQTRVGTVVGYWERWMARFPTVKRLADADLDDVLALWSGLGYYSRARLLHRAARTVVADHGGVVPAEVKQLEKLPGLGPYTVGAIASIAFDQPVPVVDGNVERVLARVLGIEEPTRAEMWAAAAERVPARGAGDYNQGLMDIGATICTPKAPRCLICPLAEGCRARREGRPEELPLRKKKGPVAEIAVDAVVIRRGDEWLLCRRQPKGLFGGLWELPEAAALDGVRVGEEVLARHRHFLTHRTIDYRVRAGAGQPQWRNPYDRGRWVRPEEIEGLGVSAATLALAARLRERDNPWQIPNARRSSSAKATKKSSRG